MREEFENLPEIARRLYQLEYRPDINAYISKPEYCVRYVNFVNGAWYAFQEQQRKIDEIIKSNIAVSDQLDRFKKELLK